MNDTVDYDSLTPEYIDAKGVVHILCACGHYVSGPKSGTKLACCPNCYFILRLEYIPCRRPDRLPDKEAQQ